MEPGAKEETVSDIYVGKRVPIFLTETMRLVGEFKVVAVDREQGVCDVEWPNGHLDPGVPLESMLGDMTFLDPSEVDQYINR